MQFRYILEDAGWATATVSDDHRQIDVTVSYLHDSLDQLAEAILALGAGQNEATVIFMDEPGEHHLVLRREGEDAIAVQVKWYKDWASWNMHPVDQYDVVFETSTGFIALRESIIAALNGILVEHGLEGYKEKWLEYDFPQEAYEQLLHSVSPNQ